MPDFFEMGEAYTSTVGSFHCVSTLEEHGKRYAWGRWFSYVAATTGGSVPRTLREADYPGFTRVA